VTCVVAFAVYTQDAGVLKLSAQLYPLMPDESREVRLELKKGETWEEAAKESIVFPGWSAHFRIENWDGSKDVPYRVRHGEEAMFEGLIRKDPVDKDVIVVGNLSCNSSQTKGPRPTIVDNLKKLDPDAPHEILLVLDATTGQNALSQVSTFKELVNVTGLVVTKLDGTAKGGILVALAKQFGLPVHAIGVGEGAEDMKPFEAAGFARSLMGLAD